MSFYSQFQGSAPKMMDLETDSSPVGSIATSITEGSLLVKKPSGWRPANDESIELIETKVASGAEVTFLNMTEYSTYILVMENVLGATDAANILMEMSIEAAGDDWNVTGYDSGVNYCAVSDPTLANVLSTTNFILSGALASEVQGACGEVYLYNFNAAFKPVISGNVGFFDDVAELWSQGMIGGLGAANSAKSIRLAMSAGDFATGKFRLYGVRGTEG